MLHYCCGSDWRVATFGIRRGSVWIGVGTVGVDGTLGVVACGVGFGLRIRADCGRGFPCVQQNDVEETAPIFSNRLGIRYEREQGACFGQRGYAVHGGERVWHACIGLVFRQKTAESGFADQLSAEFGHGNMRWLGNSRCGASYQGET